MVYDIKNNEMYRDAIQVQDACNIAAVLCGMRDAAIAVRTAGYDPRKDPAVMAFFFKVYDMMGSPSVTEMNDALKRCEEITGGLENVHLIPTEPPKIK